MEEVPDGAKVVGLTVAPPADGELLYAVDLWDLSRQQPERVIGRAASMLMARAIFAAAQSEHLGRRIVLRRGDQVLETAG